MRKMSGQNTVVVVVLLLIIAIAAAFMIKAAKPKPTPRIVVDWTCEICDHGFVAENQPESRICPECGGEAVRTHYYYCSVHDHIFEVYRAKFDPDVSEMLPPAERYFYKVPGEEWFKGRPDRFACPEGNSDMSTISPAGPHSEYRQ